MNPGFTNTVTASFYYFIDNKIADELQAYTNYTSKLYYVADPRLGSSYVSYVSPFKQWIYDAGVSGAHICTEISGDVNLDNFENGLQIDYLNGRVILPAAYGTGLSISGTYAFREVNTYLPNETEEQLITETKYYKNPRFGRNATGAINIYDYVTPAIFVNSLNTNNKAFAFGGTDTTNVNMSLVVFTDTNFQLNALLALGADINGYCFPQRSIYDWPLNEFGNIKTGLYPNGYNYKNIVAEYGTPGNLLFIDKTNSSKLSDSIKGNNSLFAGIIDIDVSKERQT